MTNRCFVLPPAIALMLTLASATTSAIAQATQPDAIVEAQRTLAGNQKARPSGAKGQCVAGTFTSAPEAKTLSESLVFDKLSKVLARLRGTEND